MFPSSCKGWASPSSPYEHVSSNALNPQHLVIFFAFHCLRVSILGTFRKRLGCQTFCCVYCNILWALNLGSSQDFWATVAWKLRSLTAPGAGWPCGCVLGDAMSQHMRSMSERGLELMESFCWMETTMQRDVHFSLFFSQ